MAYGDEPAFNLPMVGNWIRGIAESTKRPGTTPRWGGESGGSTSTRTPASSGKPIPIRTGDRKLGPFDEGYVKPTNTVMDVIPEAAKDPSKRTTRQILPPQETRKIPGGGEQTGRNLGGGGTPIDMSRSFNDLLAGVGQKPFSSNQLPGTDTNPFSATSAKTPGYDMSQGDFGGAAAVNFDAEGGVAAIRSKNLQDDEPYNPGAPQIAGGSERISQQATGISSGRLSDALEGVKTQEASREMTPERRQLMARAAFLNADDSMSGLKARDAVNDVVYAGGQHYGRGALSEDSGLGDKYKIDRADSRDIASGKTTAAGLLDTYKTRITETQKATPAQNQDPLSSAGEAVKSGFAAGAKTDFDLNNKQGAPQSGVGPVVPTDQIPKDLSGEAGEEYLRKLDAGLLFNK